MSSSPSSPFPAPENAIPDTPQSPDLPLTMASSIILTHLPRDAASALSNAADFPKPKVTVQFRAIGSAPILARSVVTITATQRFETVVSWLRKRLKVQEGESVFLYVNSSFAPALDEVVGNLHRCFKDSKDQLVIAYSMTPAFG